MADKYEELQKIGQNAADVLSDMVRALECDYDRLEELREERDAHNATGEDTVSVTPWAEEFPDDAAELADLEAAAGECEDREDAARRIQEDPLSVEVRSGWVIPGENMAAEEFCILLCTGGPAVRIMGELDGGEPRRAWLEAQDWFTPWTQVFGVSQEMLLTYAREFYYGD